MKGSGALTRQATKHQQQVSNTVNMSENDVFKGVGINWLDDSDWVTPPLQQRSRKTILKIITSAKSLFIKNGYQETSMAEICRVSGVSMGTIYHHFPDKKSIFYLLLDMYKQFRFEQVASLTQPAEWQNKSAEEVLAFHIELMFSNARSDLGFIRLMERQRIVDPLVCQRLKDWAEHIVEIIHSLMRPHAQRIKHDDLRTAIRYTHNTLRGALIWSALPQEENDPTLDPFSDEYKKVTYDMAASYLGIDSSFRS